MSTLDIIKRFAVGLQANEITVRLSEDEPPALIVQPDALGPYENGCIIMEISGIAGEEDGWLCFELLTSVAKNIPLEKFGGLLVKLNDLNKREMPGCYGLLDESGILFHRYTLFVPENAALPEEYLAEAMGQVLGRIDLDFMELFLALG